MQSNSKGISKIFVSDFTVDGMELFLLMFLVKYLHNFKNIISREYNSLETFYLILIAIILPVKLKTDPDVCIALHNTWVKFVNSTICTIFKLLAPDNVVPKQVAYIVLL